MGAGRFPAGLILACACLPAAAGELRMLLHTSPVAGLSHYEAATLWPRLQVGDALELQTEPDNPHDPRAVRVLWQGHPLGYLPAARNAPLAHALAAGKPLTARIRSLQAHPDPRQRISIDVLLRVSAPAPSP